MKTDLHAVLTGDLVKSSRLTTGELKVTRTALLAAVSVVKRWQKGLVLSRAEFFRGDSWQVLLSDPAFALRVALYLRARLKARRLSDTRIGIGIGPVDHVARTRVSLSSGAAFTLSGHALDELPIQQRMAIAVSSAEGEAARWLPVVVGLCDTLAGRWKPQQSEIVAWALSPRILRQEDIAARLETPVTRQAVAKSLKGANWYNLKSAIDEFERVGWHTA